MNVPPPARGSTLRWSLVPLLVLLAAGCSKLRGGPENPFDDRAQVASRIRIEVLNLNYNDVTLHARRGSERQRLGIITGKSEQRYTMEWGQTLPLQLEVDMLAGGSCMTPPLYIDPGQTVLFQIDVQFRNGDCQQLRTR